MIPFLTTSLLSTFCADELINSEQDLKYIHEKVEEIEGKESYTKNIEISFFTRQHAKDVKTSTAAKETSVICRCLAF